MHFGEIADMLWLSQVFGNFNIAGILEIYQILELQKLSGYIAVKLLTKIFYLAGNLIRFLK